MFTLEDIFYIAADSVSGYAALALFLFIIMDERGPGRLNKLPALLLAPPIAASASLALRTLFPDAVAACYCGISCVNLLMCTLWARWAWRTGFWSAFAAVCMAGFFQVSVSTLSRLLFLIVPLDRGPQFAVVSGLYWIAALCTAALLRRLRFGRWFRLLLENGSGRRRTALLLFAMEASMELFILLQEGVRPEFLVHYYLLVAAMAALAAGLVVYLARQFDAARKIEAQQDMMAQ